MGAGDLVAPVLNWPALLNEVHMWILIGVLYGTGSFVGTSLAAEFLDQNACKAAAETLRSNVRSIEHSAIICVKK